MSAIVINPLTPALATMTFREGERFSVQAYFAKREHAEAWDAVMRLSPELQGLSELEKTTMAYLFANGITSARGIADAIEGTTIKLIVRVLRVLEVRGMVECSGWVDCEVTGSSVLGWNITPFAFGLFTGESDDQRP